LRRDPQIRLLVRRTPEEYVFVGHTPMALNMRKQFMTCEYDADDKGPVMRSNPDFMEAVKAKLKPTDTIYVMCRSGGRNAKTVDMLAEAGYTKVYKLSMASKVTKSKTREVTPTVNGCATAGKIRGLPGLMRLIRI
jgi:rhodanese-related sulfurtransferase